jgi:hypothetical protein
MALIYGCTKQRVVSSRDRRVARLRRPWAIVQGPAPVERLQALTQPEYLKLRLLATPTNRRSPPL